MTPPGKRSPNPPRLLLVGNGEPIATPELAAPDAAPSAPEAPASLPPRSNAVNDLRAILNDGAPSLNHFQRFSTLLSELANPTASGGYDLRIPLRSGVAQILQENPDAEIRVRITQERPAAPGSAPEVIEIHRLTYLPDGRLTSTLGATPHAEPSRGPEYNYHSMLRTFLSERAYALFKGADFSLRVRNALEGLRGRYNPQTQAVWYDHFAVQNGRVFSFRRTSAVGLSELISSPQLNQIEIYEETGSEKVRIAILSANGESEFQADRPLREPLSHQNLRLLESLTAQLEEAHQDPKAYETRLRASLRAIEAFKGISPSVERSIEIPRTISVDTPRGYFTEYRSGWDLLRSLSASHRWQNPSSLDEVRYLKPNWRIRRAMSWELLRWATGTTIYGLFQSIRSPKPAADRLRLELHAGGGSQLTIYRNQDIHDILIAGPDGKLWRADQEIRQLLREGMSFPNRMEALRAAVARYNPESALPITLHVQEAPTFDLNRIHLDANGAEIKITTAQQAWELLRRQLPDGSEPRIEFRTEDNLLSNLFAASEPNRIIVDFRESRQPLSLDIRHQGVRVGDAEVPSVQILMRRGEDHFARVFQDGLLRLDLSTNANQASLRAALDGNVPRHFVTRFSQGLLRGGLFLYSSGRAYGISHFLALPFLWAHERLAFNDFERRAIGTPGPAVQFSWDNIGRNILVPYGVMSTGASIGTVMVDGVFNALPGLQRSFVTWNTTEATLAQAWGFHRPGFFNPSPLSRPVGANVLFRGFLQRAVPLFMGVMAMDWHYSGQWISPMFWRTTRDLAAVSAASAGLLRLAYASPRISGALVRRELLTEATAGLGGARFALTFRGQLALTVLEMIALGVINAHERRALLAETGRSLRSALGSAIDRRNELITRLENGEEVPPRYLVEADGEIHNAQGAYRRFLELTERTRGTGNYSTIGGGNDFEDETRRYERELTMLAASPGDPLAAARVESEHRERSDALLGRYESMESDLADLYASYGVNGSGDASGNSSLREFLSSAVHSSEPDTPVSSPVAVDSIEGRDILEQLRWKAAEDPGSVLWTRERRADYILAQFRGYRVTETDGNRRPWNRAEAMAFLSAVEQENITRIRNLETPLTVPGPNDRFDTGRLEALLAAERRIRERETSSHRHASSHAAALADNSQDLDRQMEAYYRSTNERTSLAMSRMVAVPTLAMADGLAGAAAMRLQ